MTLFYLIYLSALTKNSCDSFVKNNSCAHLRCINYKKQLRLLCIRLGEFAIRKVFTPLLQNCQRNSDKFQPTHPQITKELCDGVLGGLVVHVADERGERTAVRHLRHVKLLPRRPRLGGQVVVGHLLAAAVARCCWKKPLSFVSILLVDNAFRTIVCWYYRGFTAKQLFRYNSIIVILYSLTLVRALYFNI